MAILGLREYARHRGTSLSTVQKAINSGRISTLSNGMIDSEVADREWQENTHPRTKGVSRKRQDDDDAFGAAQYSPAPEHRVTLARLAKGQKATEDLVPIFLASTTGWNLVARVKLLEEK